MNTQKMILSVLISILACSQVSLAGHIGDSETVMRLGKFSISPYSYVIEPFNSTHYQSINASGYVYQSTNASKTILFAMGNSSGVVFVKNALYLIDTRLAIPSDVTLVLEQGTELRKSAVGDWIILFDAVTNAHVIGLGLAKINGWNQATYIVDFRASSHCSIENLELFNISWSAVHTYRGLNLTMNNLFLHHVASGGQWGFEFNGMNYSRITNIYEDGADLAESGMITAPDSYGGCVNWNIFNNVWLENNHHNGLYIAGGSPSSTNFNRFTNIHTKGNNKAGDSRVGIKIIGGSFNYVEHISENDYVGFELSTYEQNQVTEYNEVHTLINGSRNLGISIDISGGTFSNSFIRGNRLFATVVNCTSPALYVNIADTCGTSYINNNEFNVIATTLGVNASYIQVGNATSYIERNYFNLWMSGGSSYYAVTEQGTVANVRSNQFKVSLNGFITGAFGYGFGSLSINYFDENSMIDGKPFGVYGTNTTARDGAIQDIIIAGMPDYVFVTSGNATATITGADGLAVDHFHYCLHDDAGAATVGDQTVYWYARYNP